jgi:hypothetical protein
MTLTGESRNSGRETYPNARSTTTLTSGLYLKINFAPRCKHSVSVIKIHQLNLLNPLQGNNAVCSDINTEQP